MNILHKNNNGLKLNTTQKKFDLVLVGLGILIYAM